MAHVINTPKDGIGEMIERCTAIERTLKDWPASGARDDALAALRSAGLDLSLARSAVARMGGGRVAV